MNHYRLKQTDFNGDYETFDIRSIEIKENIENDIKFNTYPNPFEVDFNIEFELAVSQQIQMQLFNNQGVQVYSEVLMGETGFNKFNISPDFNLINGMYIVSLISEGQLIGSKKILKK